MTVIKTGDTPSITFTITNPSTTVNALLVTVTFTGDTGVTITNVTGGGSFNPGTGVYTLGTLSAGTSHVMTVVTDVNDVALGLDITGVLASTPVDSPLGNNTIVKNLLTELNAVRCTDVLNCTGDGVEVKYCINDENDPSDIFLDTSNPTTVEVLTWAQGEMTTQLLHNGTIVTYDPVTITYNTVYSYSTGWMDTATGTTEQDYLGVTIGGTDYLNTINMITSGAETGGAAALIDTHITNSLTTEGYTVNSVTVVYNGVTEVFDVDIDITGTDIPSIVLQSDFTTESSNGTTTVIQTGTIDCSEPTYVWSLNQKAQDSSSVITKIRG